MIVIMNSEATQEEIDKVIEQIESTGLKAESSSGEQQTVLSIIGDKTKLVNQSIESMKGVDRTIPGLNKKNKRFAPKNSAYEYSKERLAQAKSGNRSGQSSGNWGGGFDGGVFLRADDNKVIADFYNQNRLVSKIERDWKASGYVRHSTRGHILE